MKLFTNISRLLVGCLFIFSGFIKSNDPTGFSYKLDEYFSVFSNDFKAEQDSLSVLFNNQEVLKTAIVVGNNIRTFTTQNKEWETLIVGDSIAPDTISSSEFVLFLDNSLIIRDTINGPKTFVYELKSAKQSLFKKEISIKELEVKQTEEKIDISSEINKDSFLVGFFYGLKKYALIFAIFVCVIEILLGFALLIGWNPKLIVWSLFLMTLSFTFLTWYSAVYNKVTDCGCFGDAIPLTPYQSFYKDLILSVLILFLIINNRYIKPVFSNIFSINVLAFVTILATSFSLYCHYYLPFMNFLQYKPGNDIKALMTTPADKRSKDYIIITYIYKDKQGNEQEVVYDSDKGTFNPKVDYDKWTYDRIKNEKIIAYAYRPPIHDFRVLDAQRNKDYTEDFFNTSPVKLLIVFQDVKKANKNSLKKLSKIATEWKENGHQIWAITASSPEDAEMFRHENQLPFDFYYGDDTNLKSIIRSNPGLLLITDSSVVKKTWPSALLPKFKQIEKLANRSK
jgi:uncharacterized membrane protein YphA (DoxX/SURF4 family)